LKSRQHEVYNKTGESEMKTKLKTYEEDERRAIVLERAYRKVLLKNMKHMPHDEADDIAKKQTRLLEMSMTNKDLYVEVEKTLVDVLHYCESDSYTFGDDVHVELSKDGENKLLVDNMDFFIEVFELSTRLVKKEVEGTKIVFKLV